MGGVISLRNTRGTDDAETGEKKGRRKKERSSRWFPVLAFLVVYRRLYIRDMARYSMAAQEEEMGEPTWRAASFPLAVWKRMGASVLPADNPVAYRRD